MPQHAPNHLSNPCTRQVNPSRCCVKIPCFGSMINRAGCHSGVRLCSVFPLGSSAGLMQEDDVLLEIDGTEISQDATVPLRDNERIHFGHLITKHVAGRESVKVKLWRESKALEVDVALRPDRWLVPRIDGYDAAAEYAIIGGLVFIPLSHPWAELKSHDKHWSSSRALIHHYWGEALDQEGRQVVVLSKVLVSAAGCRAFASCCRRRTVALPLG
eukprot:s1367_g9.t1